MSNEWRRNGDAAEKKFLEYAKAKGMDVERYGFDKTPLTNFEKLPHFVRATPDFVATRKHQGFLVECKAGGNYDTVNLKHTDFPVLKAWAAVAPLYLFINDSKHRRVSFVIMQNFMSYLEHGQHELSEGRFPNGVPHIKIPKHLLPWESYDAF